MDVDVNGIGLIFVNIVFRDLLNFFFRICFMIWNGMGVVLFRYSWNFLMYLFGNMEGELVINWFSLM